MRMRRPAVVERKDPERRTYASCRSGVRIRLDQAFYSDGGVHVYPQNLLFAIRCVL